MPYVIRLTLSEARSTALIFDPDLNDKLWRPVGAGLPLTAEIRAAASKPILVSAPRAGVMPDVFGDMSGPWLIRDGVKNVIETLEPGVHNFIPVNVMIKKTLENCGVYFVLHITQAIDAVVIENTDFTEGRGQLGFEKSRSVISSFGEITLDRRAIVGHHLWRGARGELGKYTPFSHAYFCSDELHDQIEAGGYFGFKFQKCRVEEGTLSAAQQ